MCGADAPDGDDCDCCYDCAQRPLVPFDADGCGGGDDDDGDGDDGFGDCDCDDADADYRGL